MWVGGPPKPMQPRRSHSFPMVPRETSGRGRYSISSSGLVMAPSPKLSEGLPIRRLHDPMPLIVLWGWIEVGKKGEDFGGRRTACCLRPADAPLSALRLPYRTRQQFGGSGLVGERAAWLQHQELGADDLLTSATANSTMWLDAELPREAIVDDLRLRFGALRTDPSSRPKSPRRCPWVRDLGYTYQFAEVRTGARTDATRRDARHSHSGAIGRKRGQTIRELRGNAHGITRSFFTTRNTCPWLIETRWTRSLV
jgi:hypothetical protein